MGNPESLTHGHPARMTSFVRVIPQPERFAEVLRTLRSIIGPTQAESGCLRCSLCQDVLSENEIILFEEWATQADLDRHLRSAEYRKILAALDLSSQPPEVLFHVVGETRGLEAVAAARQ